MVHITRREHFSAAHKLAQPDWSDEKNMEVFGKCSNLGFYEEKPSLREVFFSISFRRTDKFALS